MHVRPASWDDLEQVATLLGGQTLETSGIAGIPLEHLRNEWKRPGFVLGEDSVVIEDGGVAAGYGAVSPDGALALAAADGAVADRLFARLAARARERGVERISVTVRTPGGPLAGLVERNRFELESEVLLMWRPLEEPVEEPELLPGITIRTFEPRDGRAVHSLLDEAYRTWDTRYVPVAHDDWVGRMTGDPEFEAGVWWLAERDGTLVGCALHWNSAWLKDLAVRDTERGHGLGAALVQKGLAEFGRRGATRVGLKVDAANPTGAVRLYERLGFMVSSRETLWGSSL